MVSIRQIVASTKMGLAGVALVAGVLGCGSSTTNNDQGASFSALGFFQLAEDGTSTGDPKGLSGFNTSLSSDSAASGYARQSTALLGLENRLRFSFIRVTKVDCDYFVPGASIPIPSDSFATNGFIGASPDIGGPQIGGTGGSGGVGGTGGSSGSSTDTASTSNAVTGGNATGAGTKQYVTIQTISPSIFGYLNSNRNALPEYPFQLQILCTATGITNAGKVLETNPVGLTAVMIEPSYIDIEGTTDGTETGGDVSGFDGGDSANSADGTTTVDSTGSLTAPEGEIIPVTN